MRKTVRTRRAWGDDLERGAGKRETEETGRVRRKPGDLWPSRHRVCHRETERSEEQAECTAERGGVGEEPGGHREEPGRRNLL